jgi:hypothetical protein
MLQQKSRISNKQNPAAIDVIDRETKLHHRLNRYKTVYRCSTRPIYQRYTAPGDWPDEEPETF